MNKNLVLAGLALVLIFGALFLWQRTRTSEKSRENTKLEDFDDSSQNPQASSAVVVSEDVDTEVGLMEKDLNSLDTNAYSDTLSDL